MKGPQITLTGDSSSEKLQNLARDLRRQYSDVVLEHKDAQPSATIEGEGPLHGTREIRKTLLGQQ